MDEMLRSVTRGWEIMTRAAGPFLLAGAVWTALNSLALWLLIGPALRCQMIDRGFDFYAI